MSSIILSGAGMTPEGLGWSLSGPLIEAMNLVRKLILITTDSCDFEDGEGLLG